MDRSARLNRTGSEASQQEHGVTPPGESGFPQLIGQIAAYQSSLSPGDQKKYRLALFLRISKRVAEFAPDCEECRKSESQLRQLADYLAQVHTPKFWRRAYFVGMDRRLGAHHPAGAAASRGAYVAIDLHRFGAPTDDSVDFWKEAAARYKNHPAVLFDLFNEPHDISWEVWRNGGTVEDKKQRTAYESPGMQRLVDAVREAVGVGI